MEVVERQREVTPGIQSLLERQRDVEADGQTAGLLAAAVGRLHHTRAASGDDSEARLGECTGGRTRLLVRRRSFVDAGRSEDRHGRPIDLLDELEPGEELGGDQGDVGRERFLAPPEDPARDLHAVRHQKSRSTYVADIASASTATRPR